MTTADDQAQGSPAQADETTEERTGYSFGTFQGVYTPSILTILGVIMYLRFGWVLGNVGLTLTLVIVTMSCAITFFTALSLSALATNMKVGGGGAYYIISRSLGVEAGAAIGVPLYFAQALGVAFYIAGFSEALVSVFPALDPRWVGVSLLIAISGLSLVSADVALKSQYVILALIAASLVSVFCGTGVTGDGAATVAPPPVGFWIVFAVFFPAVTGIEAGLALSGDLRKPSRSLPVGTLCAVLTGFAVYIAIPVFLSYRVSDNNLLLTNNMILRDVARWGVLITLGVLGASVSSALGSLLGAPRTLQSLAKDRVVPRFISKGWGARNDPHVATVLTLIIALLAILNGDLNVIAPVLTMFFLTSYGLLNLSAGLEEIIGSPAWRPTLRVPALLSIAASLACLATMLMINAGATLVAVAVTTFLYAIMKRRSLSARWGDVRYGALMLLAQLAVRRLAQRKPDERTWKPNVLVVCRTPDTRMHLIELAHSLAPDISRLTVATIVPPRMWTADRVDSVSEAVRSYLLKHDIEAMVKVLPSHDLNRATEAMIAAYGFGPLVPNTIVLGEPDDAPVADTARVLTLASKTRRNLVLVRESGESPESKTPRVDVWLRRQSSNSGLMLILADIMLRDETWSSSSLCVRTVVDPGEGLEDARVRLTEIVGTYRLDAEIDVQVKDQRPVYEMIREASGDGAVTYVGIRHPQQEEEPESYCDYLEQLLQRTEGLPAAVLVLAAEDINFSRVLAME